MLYFPFSETTPTTAGIEQIPEVHCYLKLEEQRSDYFTGLTEGKHALFDSLIAEHTVSPYHLPEVKVKYHRSVLNQWAHENAIDPDRAWLIREACITALAARQ